jgi:hypothetical protein
MQVDTKEIFESQLRNSFPEEVSICGQEFDQVAVLKAASPLTFLETYFEWLRENISNGVFITLDGGQTFRTGSGTAQIVPRAITLIRPLAHV